MSLTASHAVFLEGMLIPVGALVNGRSILRGERAQAIEFYHVELERQDVLLAQGAPAESYRDDGNRMRFHNAEEPRFAEPGGAPFAQVMVSGPQVEHVWRRLSERAGMIPTALTDDPDLHLVADGRRIDPLSRDGTILRFRLDGVAGELRIASRQTVPVLLGPGADRRTLGVGLCCLRATQPCIAIEIDYDAPCLSQGFHAPEPKTGLRWTPGDAIVPALALCALAGPFEVELDAAAAHYPDTDQGRSIRQVEEFAPAFRADVALHDLAGARRAEEAAGGTSETVARTVLVLRLLLRHFLRRRRSRLLSLGLGGARAKKAAGGAERGGENRPPRPGAEPNRPGDSPQAVLAT
ncbi:MAG: Hint domain-containing protein [Alphaproteobacteria bacterium]|nr:Hint domain-containing protein [Alphaproteobacteria bacterium]